MSIVPATRQHVMGVRFHPTDAELINHLKRFFKGEPFSNQCPIQFVDIYGDHPPWEIFGASEEKIRYFITPLKKKKSEHIRFCRTCTNGTWKGQTGEYPIKNPKRTLVGFRRNFTFETKEPDQKKTWLMKEYVVADDFFKENNIPKQNFVLCRIKKNTKEKKVKDLGAITYDMEEQDVAGIIEAMLHAPDDDYGTKQPAEDQVMKETDQWDSIINEVCDQQVDEVENTTTLHGEKDEHYLTGSNQNDQFLNAITTILEEETYSQIEQVQGHGDDHQTDIGSIDFWETMNGILGDIGIDILDDLWLDDQSSLLLDSHQNI